VCDNFFGFVTEEISSSFKGKMIALLCPAGFVPFEQFNAILDASHMSRGTHDVSVTFVWFRGEDMLEESCLYEIDITTEDSVMSFVLEVDPPTGMRSASHPGAGLIVEVGSARLAFPVNIGARGFSVCGVSL